MLRFIRKAFWNKSFRRFLWKCDVIPISCKELESIWGSACYKCHLYYIQGNKTEEQFHQGVACQFRQLLNDYMPD